MAKSFSGGGSLGQKILILIVILLIAYGCYYKFVLEDKLAKIESLKREIQTVESVIAKYRSEIAKIPELERTIEARQQEFFYAKMLLPEDAQALEELLASFEKLGRDENVDFELFKPDTKEAPQDFFATRGIELKVNGTFHRLVTYFDHLSRLNRLVTIENIEFKPKSVFSQEEEYLNASLKLQVYRAMNEAEMKSKSKQKK